MATDAEQAALTHIIARIQSIPSYATRVPGGVWEGQIPEKNSSGVSLANKLAVKVELEAGGSLLGQGAIHVYDEMTYLIDVVVPGTSKGPGYGIVADIRAALSATSGDNASGSVTSCVYRGPVPAPPEHTDTGEDYEHLVRRYELHARGNV